MSEMVCDVGGLSIKALFMGLFGAFEAACEPSQGMPRKVLGVELMLRDCVTAALHPCCKRVCVDSAGS